jgi:UDP-glucose 4-epimerase
MGEAMTPQPEDPYGISKYAVELDLAAAHEMFGLDYTIFRPHNVYGERQNIADPYRNVIGIFMTAALAGQPMPVFGDGQQTRAFSYIDDVAPLIARAPLVNRARNQVINIGADQPYTVIELAELVAWALAVPCEVKHLPARSEVVHAFASHAKAKLIFKNELQEPLPLAIGIQQMALWARGAHVFCSRLPNVEVDRNLPASWATVAS